MLQLTKSFLHNCHISMMPNGEYSQDSCLHREKAVISKTVC